MINEYNMLGISGIIEKPPVFHFHQKKRICNFTLKHNQHPGKPFWLDCVYREPRDGPFVLTDTLEPGMRLLISGKIGFRTFVREADSTIGHTITVQVKFLQVMTPQPHSPTLTNLVPIAIINVPSDPS